MLGQKLHEKMKSNRYGASPDVRRYGANVAFDIRDVSRMLKDIRQDNDNSKSKLVWLAVCRTEGFVTRKSSAKPEFRAKKRE